MADGAATGPRGAALVPAAGPPGGERHMIEQTASHPGHLQIARELLDDATTLGAR
jgi:hypothetical protein